MTMSDETARAVAEAEAAEEQQRAIVDEAKRSCLTSVADNLPGMLLDYAKKLSHAQPDVAKTLGRDGISALRSALAEAAEVLAADLRGAAERIAWPTSKRYVSKDDIHGALFKYMYGQRVDRLTAVLHSHGFRFDPTGGVLPQELYDRADFQHLANEMGVLAQAEATTAQAKALDDRDDVESLWKENN